MKVTVYGDEWYPVYSEDEDWDTEIELTDSEYETFTRVMREFREIQSIISRKVEELP